MRIVIAALAVSALCGFAGTSDVADAVQAKNSDTLRALIAKKADVNALQSDGTTALHWAAHWNQVDVADVLIANGGKAGMANRAGATPMFLASMNGNAAMIAKLLKAGADSNAPVLLHGETALMFAAKSGQLLQP